MANQAIRQEIVSKKINGFQAKNTSTEAKKTKKKNVGSH